MQTAAGAPSAGATAPDSNIGPLSAPSAAAEQGVSGDVGRSEVGRSGVRRAESQPYQSREPQVHDSDATYGPLRRLSRKTSPEQLHRPSAMLQDDFSELMHEVIPELVSQTLQATMPSSASNPNASESNPSRGVKREASAEPAERETSRRATEGSSEDRADVEDENLAIETLLVQVADPEHSIESLMAQVLNKRQSKETPCSRQSS